MIEKTFLISHIPQTAFYKCSQKSEYYDFNNGKAVKTDKPTSNSINVLYEHYTDWASNITYRKTTIDFNSSNRKSIVFYSYKKVFDSQDSADRYIIDSNKELDTTDILNTEILLSRHLKGDSSLSSYDRFIHSKV